MQHLYGLDEWQETSLHEARRRLVAAQLQRQLPSRGDRCERPGPLNGIREEDIGDKGRHEDPPDNI